MDFDAAMMRPIGLPALARCALDGTLRTSTSNRCSLSCSSRCFQRCPACSCSWNTATTRSGRWWRLHFLHSTGSVDAPRARVARIARVAPHTIHTHTFTQSPPRQPSRRRAARLGRSGAAEQRAMGGAAGRADAGRGRRGPNSIAGTPKGGLAVGWPRADSGGEGRGRSAAASEVRPAGSG